MWKQAEQAKQTSGDKTKQSIDELKKFSSSLSARGAGAPPSDKEAVPSAAAVPAPAAPKPAGSKLSLNPNAKPFTLNFAAKEFVPPGGGGAAAAPAAPKSAPRPAPPVPDAGGEGPGGPFAGGSFRGQGGS